MNILPKKFSDFKQKKYWDTFFQSLKSTDQQYFEWYGNYSDFRTFFPKILKPQHKTIFNVGCGKSIFAEDFLKEYPKMQIISCDYSEDVIRDMQKRSKQMNIDLEYVVCDLLKDLSANYINKFDIVVDKGTLDAILPQDQPGNIQKIMHIYFRNIQQSLVPCSQNTSPKYILISMLQPHVLTTILKHFLNRPCSIDIYQCLIKDSQMQPFLVDITFTIKKQNKIVLHYLTGQSRLFDKQQQISKEIKTMQVSIEHSSRVRKLIPGQRLQFNVFDQQQKLRYSLEVIDQQNKKWLQKNTCSVFISPQGWENSFLYGSEKGLKMLHDQVTSSRLIVAKLVTGNVFKSMEEVKKQLNNLVPDLVQKGVNIKQVPYLTDGNQLGQRQYLYQDQSIIIEQVIIDQQAFRRLVLKDNLSMTQTQYKLSYCSLSNNPELKQLQTGILPNKKNMIVGIDRDYLDEGCFRSIAAGIIGIIGEKRMDKDGCRILFLGGGGCCVPKFLFQHYQSLQIVIVQLDKSIVKVAKKYFQLPDNQQFQIIQAQAYEYVMSLKQDEKFDAIVLDINGNEGQSSPPPLFLSQEFVKKISLILQPNIGVFVCHLIRRDTPPILKQYFNPIYSHYNEMELVSVLFCLNRAIFIQTISEEEMVIVGKDQLRFKPINKPRFNWEQQIYSTMRMIEPKDGEIFRKRKVYIDQDGKFMDSREGFIKNGINKGKNKNKKNKKR